MNQIQNIHPNHTNKKKWLPLLVFFWLLVWQLATMLIQNNIVFASPLETLQALLTLAGTRYFWITVFSSFGKIALGFFLATTLGTLLAVLSACSKAVRLFLLVPIQFIKTVPVVSFIILALFWIPSRQLSILISFLMVLPVMYTNVQKGIDHTDIKQLEMAKTYRIGFCSTLRYIYIPAIFPFFLSACSIGLGFCFKSGIAAEVIGLPSHSIGEALYEAKLYLLTKDVFAWTLVIISISICFEKSILFLLRKLQKRMLTMHIASNYTSSAVFSKNNALSSSFKIAEKMVMPDSKQDAKPLIELKQVTKQFNTQTVLQNFSLTIHAGDTIACMGPSGIGKTTLSRLLLELLSPDTGTVITSKPLPIATVFQENRLCMEADAITNVLFAAFPHTKTTQEKQLAILQIKDVFTQMQLTDYEGKPVSQLSGGMQRRVALARALLSKSKLLLLDEPFKGLDPTLKQKAMQLTKELRKERALFLITHDKTEAEFFECNIIQLESPLS